MAVKCLAKALTGCGRTLNDKFRTYQISSLRKFNLLKVLYTKEKYTVELIPEVEKLLESGEIKHRKHPGIRKREAIILPETLRTSVDKIVSHESEKVLLEEAKTLCDYLTYRRLPVEAEEIDRRVSAIVPGFEGKYEDLSEILNKQQLKILRRRIASEIGRWKPIEYNCRECFVYLVGRLAANYASTSYVFNQLMDRLPSFAPMSYFDFGCGVGSALWAAHSYWPDTIKEYFCVDASADMLELCQNILTDEVTEEKHINPVFFRQFLPASETIKYDLVVSAFSLLDLPTTAERLRVIDTLWRKTKDILVVIEYGTVAGFHCVSDARDYILQVENDSSPEFSYYSSGTYVVSPCPHDFGCPKMKEKSNSSCGFIVPYQIQFPRRLTQATAKDWISYVILKKGHRPEGDVPQPRLVKPVLKRAQHIHCHLCCEDGKMHEVVVTKSKHGRHAYRCARESKQGDILPVNVFSLQTLPQQKD